MTQKTRIAILAPMLALALVGTLFTMTADVQADDLVFFEASEVSFEDCVSTAQELCGTLGVANFSYNEESQSCSFGCRGASTQ